MTTFRRLDAYLVEKGRQVDRELARLLPPAASKPAPIHAAMRYSIFAGGKRLRPALVIAAAELCGGRAAQVLPAACALELVHTYSLVHDDLPAMDDDDLRRGRPTNHKVYGEDIAILAGDALLTEAFRLLALCAGRAGVSPSAVAAAVGDLALGAGSRGMVGGQVADIKADGGRWRRLKDPHFRTPAALLEYIHLNKTAALIRASLVVGARLAGGSATQIRALDRYGRAIGLTFQIQDDILDRVGDKKKLGKRGSDLANKKLTYVALHGIESSRKTARKLTETAHASLRPFGSKAAVLHDLADFLLTRDH